MKAKQRSLAIRIVGLVLAVAAGAWILLPPLVEKREERRIRTMLLTVQEFLQNYHIDEEIYPRRMMTGAELVAFLDEAGFVEGPILNPWTKEDYGREGEEDWLRYRTDPLAETYELIVYEAETEIERFRLDSTENQSLE
jgi:hypothetical protein